MKIQHAIALMIAAGALRLMAQAPAVFTNAADLPAQFDTNAEPKVVQPAQIQVSPALAEVVRLAQSGTDETVIIAYIRKTPSYSISADEILYLRDLGISDAIIGAVVEHGGQTGATPGMTPARSASPTTNVTPVAPAVAAPVDPTSAPPAAVATAPVTPPATVAEFYQPLSPYGTWVNVEPYGWCWQPNVVVVNAGWNPYCDNGYWMWSDSGWYWHSYYSWGWAPFHYGRWFYHPHRRWVWAPDHVWGPSWVSWRETPGYYGWAPLPPGASFSVGIGWTFGGHHVGPDFAFGISSAHFTFVGSGHFTDHHLAAHRLPPREVNVVYNKTTVINNYTVGSNNRIINRGVDRQRVEAATGTRVHEVAVKEMPGPSARPNTAVMPDRITKVGRADIVYKPGPKIEVPRPASAIARGPREVPTHATPALRPTSPRTIVPAPDSSKPALEQPKLRPHEVAPTEKPQTAVPPPDKSRPSIPPDARVAPQTPATQPRPVAPPAQVVPTTPKSVVPAPTPPPQMHAVPVRPSRQPVTPWIRPHPPAPSVGEEGKHGKGS